MSQPAADQKVKLVVPENTLKKKVGNGGFDQATLRSAQNMIENNTVDFRPMALELNAELRGVIETVNTTSYTDPAHMGALMYPVMQLRAQGGLFHYPLITKTSHIFIDFLENITGLDATVMEISDAYGKVINAIVVYQLKDENSKDAKDICDALTGVCNRYYKRKNIG